MTDTVVELRSDQERMNYEAWESFYRDRGQPIPRRKIFQQVLAGVLAPGLERHRDDSGRENIESGGAGSTFDDERPDKLEDKDLAGVEKDMWRINRDSVLKATGKDAYVAPPGEKIDIIKWGKEPGQEWDQYGWAEQDKTRAKGLLMSIFQLDAITADRAIEALLLAGYTAREVVDQVENKTEFINKYKDTPNILGQIFQSVFSDGNHQIYDSSVKVVFGQEALAVEKQNYGDPQTMEELAFWLVWTGAAGGPSGEWMQTKQDGTPNENAMFGAHAETYTDANGQMRLKGKYYVNENSFLNWFRHELDVLYDIWGPDTPIQVMEQVQSRMSSMKVTRLREMVEKQEAFKSEDGKTQYLQMWLKLQLEPGIFQSLYDNDIIYRQSVVSLDKWLEQYEQMTFMNPLTKLGFRTNKIQQLLTGSSDYYEGRGDKDGGKYLSDNKLGAAFTEMVLAFYNLGDFEELQRTLGVDSSFFTRAGWIKAMKDISAIQGLRSGGGVKFTPEEQKYFDDAFKKGLHTKDGRKAFIQLVNSLGTNNLAGSHLELIVTRAIRNSVAKRFGLEVTPGLDLTTAEAWFFNRFMGGLARNDVSMTGYKNKKGEHFYTANPSVHDKLSELLNMGANRDKYASQGGGKPAGNLQTLGQFKAAAIDPMVGIVTMVDVPALDENGRPVYIDGKPVMMQKSMLQVFKEAHNLRVRQQQRIDFLREQYRVDSLPEGAEKDRIVAAIEQEEKEQNRLYQHYVADNAAFRENAHREYTQVHLKAGKAWMDRIMNGKGLDFSHFTGFDMWGGATIKRDVLIKELQKEMLGLTRDMVKKYKWMNFNETVRIPYYNRQTGEYGFRDGKLGEQMFGYDMLNRREFWMMDERGNPIKRNGMHVIDYNKVEKDRVTLMKQLFMTELAGDMMSHQKVNSGDVRYKHAYYLNMLDILKTMPGQVIIDEFRANGIDVPEGFFTKEDFKWLEARGLNGNILGINMGSFGFHLKWWISSLWDKTDHDGLGFGKALGIITKTVFSGI